MIDSAKTPLFDDEDLAEEEAGSGMPMTAAQLTAREGGDEADGDAPEPEDEDDVEDDEIDA